jgi:membrane-associated phospholipid phosphatase
VVAELVHRILHAGSSIGTAFPSSHVAISTTALLQALRYDRFVSVVLLVLVPSLALGAVYGGFHYAIDAVCGAVLALIMTPVSRWWWRRCLARAPQAGPGL